MQGLPAPGRCGARQLCHCKYTHPFVPSLHAHTRVWNPAGVGRALAEEFLRAGDSVVLCARSGDALEGAVAQLGAEFGADRVAVRRRCGRGREKHQGPGGGRSQ